MRQNPNFIKVKLSHNTYLLPTGQSVSDLKPGIMINDTGALLWDLLREDRSLAELLALSAERLEVLPEQLPDYEKDVTDFLNTLNLNGMILASMPVPTGDSGYFRTMSVAGLSVNLYGPEDAFSDEFSPFYGDYTENAHQTVLVLYGTPAVRENGTALIRNKELTVLEQGDKYIMIFHVRSRVRELHLRKDASLAVLYGIPGDTLREDVFHALRFAFLYLAQKHDILAVHSASVLYRNRAWLFSASSGTGKSTHTALWHNILNTPLINGDVNLIAQKDGKAVVCGLPWCGTSGISDTATYALGGIIFLKQAPSDSVTLLAPDEKVLALSRGLISPCWDGDMLKKQLSLSEKISDSVFMCRLACTKEPSALTVIRQEIDRFLASTDR